MTQESQLVSVETVTIDPAMAEKMLEHVSTHNRSVGMAAVNKYIYDMKRGKFNSLNGETIIVHKNGNLLDGQHRLWAILLSGVTQEFVVATVDGDESEIIKTLDNGRKRTIADFIKGKNRAAIASIGRQAYLFEKSNSTLTVIVMGQRSEHGVPSRDEVLSYIEQNMDELEMIACDAVAIRKNIGCGSPMVIGETLWLCRHFGDGTVYRKFVDAMKETVPTCPTVNAFIGSIRKAHLNGSKLIDTEYVGRLLWAYDEFAKGGTATRLNGSKSYEKYSNALRLRNQMRGAS